MRSIAIKVILKWLNVKIVYWVSISRYVPQYFNEIHFLCKCFLCLHKLHFKWLILVPYSACTDISSILWVKNYSQKIDFIRYSFKHKFPNDNQNPWSCKEFQFIRINKFYFWIILDDNTILLKANDKKEGFSHFQQLKNVSNWWPAYTLLSTNIVAQVQRKLVRMNKRTFKQTFNYAWHM